MITYDLIAVVRSIIVSSTTSSLQFPVSDRIATLVCSLCCLPGAGSIVPSLSLPPPSNVDTLVADTRLSSQPGPTFAQIHGPRSSSSTYEGALLRLHHSILVLQGQQVAAVCHRARTFCYLVMNLGVGLAVFAIVFDAGRTATERRKRAAAAVAVAEDRTTMVIWNQEAGRPVLVLVLVEETELLVAVVAEEEQEQQQQQQQQL